MPNTSPYADNEYQVSAKPIDYSTAGAPTAKTSHGLSIVVNDNIIGRITSWQPSGAYTRDGVHQYEISHVTAGLPVDYIPGRATGFTLALTRAEVWYKELEIAFGFPAVWNNLCDQDRPFSIHEFLFRGQSLYALWLYSGCWFQDRNEEPLTTEGDFRYVANATVAYVSRKLIGGSRASGS